MPDLSSEEFQNPYKTELQSGMIAAQPKLDQIQSELEDRLKGLSIKFEK